MEHLACAQARLVHSIFIPCVPPYRTHSQSGRRPSGRYRSPSVNFLNPWIKYFSSKRARLQATSMSPTACRKHRVCSTLTFYHRLRKYQHSPTDICLRYVYKRQLMDDKPVDPSKLRMTAVQCPNCGASYQAAAGYTGRCPYCGSYHNVE